MLALSHRIPRVSGRLVSRTRARRRFARLRGVSRCRHSEQNLPLCAQPVELAGGRAQSAATRRSCESVWWRRTAKSEPGH